MRFCIDTFRRRVLPVAAFALVSFLAPLAAAQTVLMTEDFEGLAWPSGSQQGPQALIDRGWQFRNQGQPVGGTPAWRPETSWPNTGAGALTAHSGATGFPSGVLSSWAILPSVTGQSAGNVLSFWVMGGGASYDTFFDVRYSPSGGTSTGSGPTAVGDFTEVLFTAEMGLSTSPLAYVQLDVALPGPGRVAVRFHAPYVNNFAGHGTMLAIDTLTIGTTASTPCGLSIPAAGETVTWTAAGSPYAVCQDIVIPVGATLVLEAGTIVQFDHERNLVVEGALLAQGTPSANVRLEGDNVSGIRSAGTVRLDACDIDAVVRVTGGGTLECFDSDFRADGWLTQIRSETFVKLVRCGLASDWIELSGTNVLEDVQITNPLALVDVLGFWNIHSLTSVAPISFTARMQDRVVDNVTVVGTQEPALELLAPGEVVDFHLGPNNVLSGNQYPVWTRHVGLTKDSTVPLAGNVNDAILGPEVARGNMRSRVRLPNFGLPYHFLERGSLIGDVRIDPGTVLRFGPLGGISVGGDIGTDATLRGIPGAPIRLEPLFAGTRWLSLSTGPGWHVFEHLDVRSAGIGVVGNECTLFLRDSIIRDCAIGATPAAQGDIFGTGVVLLDNDIGLQNDTTNLSAPLKTGIHFSGVERANVFQGNLLAADNAASTGGTLHPFPVDANWWSHPTGPYEPNFHPQGQGETVDFGVDFLPFLTAPPDLSDSRPVVRLKTRLHPIVHPGEKIFIEWEAFDDGSITGFDVQVLEPNPSGPGFQFLNLGTNLHPNRRSFELVVPVVGLHVNERFPFRIVARDDAGNVGFDQFWLVIPHQMPSANVKFLTDFGPYTGGEDVTICYDALGLNSNPRFYFETGNDDRVDLGPAGNAGVGSCTFSPIRIPYASTDRARIAMRAEGNWNRDEWYFTDYFTIRPDPRFGDAPPTVSMLSPLGGETFVGRGVIPIRWTADDDHGLREFRIQASFNGGFTFHTIATEIAPHVREYTWKLPASTGVDDLRVRVVAVDSLMQNTSDGDQRVLRVRAHHAPATEQATGTLTPQRVP